jgi:glycosyltransferase involved in cell wall biosynthesis
VLPPSENPAKRIDRPLTVLHATEALGGGITSSILQLVASTSGMQHHLVYVAREAHETGAELGNHFASLSRATDLIDLSARLRDLSATLRPDVLHLHSSWAGLVGRMRPPRGPALAYSPHSYFFERVDRPRLVRAVAWALEWILARRGHATICVSPYEQQLARRLGSPAAYMPNTIAPASSETPEPTASKVDRPDPHTQRHDGITILTMGRVAPQKDPAFFAQVVQCVRRQRPGIRWVWVGDGDARYRRPLEERGVEITGWLPRQQAMRRLREADLYLHTAAWEGSPMSLLEAATLDVPVLARSIPALTSLGYPEGLTTPTDVAGAVLARLDGRQKDFHPVIPSTAQQRQALERAYALALEEHARRAPRRWNPRRA